MASSPSLNSYGSSERPSAPVVKTQAREKAPEPFHPGLLEDPRFPNSFDAKKTIRRPVEEEGVKESVYAHWLKEELEKEQACLELPFSIVFLGSFAIFALYALAQDQVIIIENAIETDIAENANFAFSNNFGHKGIDDVNSFADFWSWTRLGLIPLIFPSAPYFYSESLDEAVEQTPGAPSYSVEALPTRQPSEGYQRPAPMQNDYLRYNKIIGGLRFRQEVSNDPKQACIYPGPADILANWTGKPCTRQTDYELPPDLVATESFSPEPLRVEWFLPEVEGNDALLQHVIDMEDGCTSAYAQNRTCLCEWCKGQGTPHPWLDDQTQRIEISFITYNAHYGMYNMASVNFWFNRGGHIFKLIFVRSCWAGIAIRETWTAVIMIASLIVWMASAIYVLKIETVDILSMIRSSPKLWYYTLADDYLGFWNCVDWCAVIMTTAICIIFMVMNIQIGTANNLLADMVMEVERNGFPGIVPYRHTVQAFNEATEAALETERIFRFWMTIFPFVLLSRLFKSFKAQKRLAIVSDTFIVARNDMMHFFIVFLSVYFCMTVNAVIFFGQDQLDFATIDRALFSCFRAMLGDWDWDSMDDIGIHKAFLWFVIFMLVMVMILLNMLLAILMESYAIVKEDAANADSLMQQIKSMVRRAQQNKRKERVKLNDIWDALYQDNQSDQDKLLSSERKIYPSYLLEIVQGIPLSQATRTLNNSRTDYDRKHDPAFELTDFKEGLTNMVTRMDYSAMCSTYLNLKLQQYQGLVNQEGLFESSNAMAALTEGPPKTEIQEVFQVPKASTEGSPEPIQQAAEKALDKVRVLAQERSVEMADGIASILGEEMQELERRQNDQKKSIDSTAKSLQNLREMIHKLNQTCGEIGELAHDLGYSDAAMLQVSALARPAQSSLQDAVPTPALEDGTI